MQSALVDGPTAEAVMVPESSLGEEGEGVREGAGLGMGLGGLVAGGVVRLGPPKTSDRLTTNGFGGLRQAQGRLSGDYGPAHHERGASGLGVARKTGGSQTPPLPKIGLGMVGGVVRLAPVRQAQGRLFEDYGAAHHERAWESTRGCTGRVGGGRGRFANRPYVSRARDAGGVGAWFDRLTRNGGALGARVAAGSRVQTPG